MTTPISGFGGEFKPANDNALNKIQEAQEKIQKKSPDAKKNIKTEIKAQFSDDEFIETNFDEFENFTPADNISIDDVKEKLEEAKQAQAKADKEIKAQLEDAFKDFNDVSPKKAKGKNQIHKKL